MCELQDTPEEHLRFVGALPRVQLYRQHCFQAHRHTCIDKFRSVPACIPRRVACCWGLVRKWEIILTFLRHSRDEAKRNRPSADQERHWGYTPERCGPRKILVADAGGIGNCAVTYKAGQDDCAGAAEHKDHHSRTCDELRERERAQPLTARSGAT